MIFEKGAKQGEAVWTEGT